MHFVETNFPLSTGNEVFVRRFLAAQNISENDLQLNIQRLNGGLDSLGVWKVQARFGRTRREHHKNKAFIIKRVTTESAEQSVHRHILPKAGIQLAPALLAFERSKSEQVFLFEFITPAVIWPWKDSDNSRLVLTSLARLHEASFEKYPTHVDYEQILQRQGCQLLELLQHVRARSPLAAVRKDVQVVRRLVERLPGLRRELLDNSSFRSCLIHGDVHSANVILQREKNGLRPVFLDWGRSRNGSPFEDVSSWLQSLGYWEPEARRRHDTLLRHYLFSRGMEDRLTEDLRGAYWLAAACNVLAGAAVFHFSVANDPQQEGLKAGEVARAALADSLRVLRRADSYCR